MLDAIRATIRPRILQPGANLGLSVIFDGLVLLTRLARGNMSGRTDSEMRGYNGAIDYEFTGDGGATWHCLIAGGRGFFHRGAHPVSFATVSMSVDQFFKLLTGETSFMIAQMTGQVRIRGDGHAAMLCGALVGGLRNYRGKNDREGRFTRGWTDLAVRVSGTGCRFQG